MFSFSTRVADLTCINIFFLQIIVIFFPIFILYLIEKYNFVCGAARVSDQPSKSPDDDLTVGVTQTRKPYVRVSGSSLTVKVNVLCSSYSLLVSSEILFENFE